MTNKDKCFYAYFAGIIDGEGSIYISRSIPKSKKHLQYKLCIKVQMTDWITVALLHQIFGGYLEVRINDTPGREKHPTLGWGVENRKAYETLQILKPFIIVKSEQVKIAMSFHVFRSKMNALRAMSTLRLKNGRFNGGIKKYDKSVWDKYERYYKLLSARNHNPTNGINSVELLKKLTLRQYRAKREDYERLLEGVTTSLNKYKGIKIPEKDIV